MKLYKAFRGAEPDKTAMLKGRGLWKEPVQEGEEETSTENNAVIEE